MVSGIFIAIAIIATLFSVVAFILYLRASQKLRTSESEQQQQALLLSDEKRQFELKISLAEERLLQKSGQLEKAEAENKELRLAGEVMKSRLDKAEVEFRNMAEKLQTQKAEMEELQKKFTTEFENIANRILKQNSEEFTAANQKNIGEILKPVREKFESFEKKVEETYLKSKDDQVDLKAELKKLSDLNVKIGEEAHNLTKALKGDVKKQGNWGEVVLERILERSGLNEGPEGYQKQYSDKDMEGKTIQPDIVINLPDKKHIIVDSKVSLIAYERAVNAQDDNERVQHIKEHLTSLRGTSKG